MIRTDVKPGYVILGSVADGLTNVILNKIEIIVPLLTQGMNDLRLHIRESASFALAKLGELSLPQASLYQSYHTSSNERPE